MAVPSGAAIFVAGEHFATSGRRRNFIFKALSPASFVRPGPKRATYRLTKRLFSIALMRQDTVMRTLNIVTLLLVIVGGLNWGLVGLFQFDLVAALFGGQTAMLARIVYILVGASAAWQLIPFFRSLSSGEVVAERATR